MSKEQIGNEVALARSHSRSYCVYIPCLDAWARTIESSDFPLPLPLSPTQHCAAAILGGMAEREDGRGRGVAEA